jgi:uncharacterized radical SAM superfamily protein
MLDEARENGDTESEVKAISLLSKVNDKLLEMVTLLPQIGIPIPQSKTSLQQYQPMSDPIFDDENERDQP